MNNKHSQCVLANNSICFSFLFLVGSVCIDSLGGIKSKQDLYVVSQKLKKLVIQPAHSFLVRGTLQLESSFLALNIANVGFIG